MVIPPDAVGRGARAEMLSLLDSIHDIGLSEPIPFRQIDQCMHGVHSDDGGMIKAP